MTIAIPIITEVKDLNMCEGRILEVDFFLKDIENVLKIVTFLM